MRFNKFIFKLMWLVYHVLGFDKFNLSIGLVINKPWVLVYHVLEFDKFIFKY